MKQRKKILSGLACGCLSVLISGGLAGCGSGGSGADTNFTFWIYSSVDSQYYTTYEENPALEYATENFSPEGTEISFEFWAPPAGTAADNYSTMIGSGDYADIIENTIGESPLNNYMNGISIDLTELVLEYMPNYVAYIEAHPEIRSDAITEIDGEDHYLSIVSFNEDYPDLDWGYEYRRDWIVKYGTNPLTGAAFTGGYTDENDPDSWQDDVVFPSGESNPLYISDWEWMFEIFDKAYEDLKIEDTYCISIQYPGFCGVGDLNSGFGGGASGHWYRNLDNKVVFGPSTDEFRSYLECMSAWYAKGWLDPHFNERTSDMFYSIDSTNVYQGRIGMWYGVTGQLGRRMDSGDALTSGICVYGASIPMNDKYGEDSTKYQTPYCGFGGTLKDTAYLITKAAENKNLAALLTYFDTFYTEEGALVRTLGLSAEQASSIDSTFYADNGLSEGAYTIGEDGRYIKSSIIRDDSGALGDAVRLAKMPGIKLMDNVDEGYPESYQQSLEQWTKYANYGFFQGTAMLDAMTEDETNTYGKISGNVGNYMSQTIPDYIMGKKDPTDDGDWETLQTMMAKYNYQGLTDIAQKYADLAPLVIREE